MQPHRAQLNVEEDDQCDQEPTHTSLPDLTDAETKDVDTDDKEPSIPKFIMADFECVQQNVVHEPNLCVAHRVCIECLDEEVDSVSECDQCGQHESVFWGKGSEVDFCEWLFTEDNEDTTVLFHNFKGYDSYFVLQYLYDNAVLPHIIFSGSKIMYIHIDSLNIRFIDSYNFMPMALAKLPKALNIPELSKGYWPHLFNTWENQNVELPNLPDMSFYNPDGMKPEQREEFLEWYNANRMNKFNFREEILKYCRSDVDILRKACLRFRQMFLEMTVSEMNPNGIDPLQECITIASACNLVFRSMFLQSETIAIIPPQGYRPEQKHSIEALQWLMYTAEKEDLYIRHARNLGEYQVGKYRLDGYYVEPDGQKVAMDYHGCLFHGCPRCYLPGTLNPVNKMSMADLYQKTTDRRRFLEENDFKIIEMWSCDFKKEISENSALKDFIQKLELSRPLSPRDSLFGGRCNAIKLYHEATGNEKIKYADFTSLYPYICKYGKFPVGHPVIYTENLTSDISRYEGLIKCTVLPPRELFHPVLPHRADGKLLFPLCAACANTLQQSECEHTDAQRAITGTWVSCELKKATEKGYIVLKVDEVWHFENVSQYDPSTKEGGLFAKYVDTFLKMKQESSDWPSWCKTDEDKDRYIDEYFAKEGIRLDATRIEKNPGLRSLAKLMLNSFWGKFAQRDNLKQHTYLTEPKEFFDLLLSNSTTVTDVRLVNDQMVRVEWEPIEEFITPSSRTNVVIAAYTTAQARLKLYEVIEELDHRVLYMDTDSVIYTCSPGEWEPMYGDFLGELTNELPSDAEGNPTHIVSFVSGGPKNYSYQLNKADKNDNITFCKVKGITLNYRASNLVNFESMRKMVTSDTTDTIFVKEPFHIARDAASAKIVTRQQRKRYQVVYTKRRLLDHYCTLPYGF